MPRQARPGNVANEFIRVILTEIGVRAGGLSNADWERTLKMFDYRCAYTGAKLEAGDLDQDHAVPLNRKHGGLHVFGNVVPATRLANSQKAGKRYDEFLRSTSIKLTSLKDRTTTQREESLAFIEKFMAGARHDNLLAVHPDLLKYYGKKYEEVKALCAATSAETADLLQCLQTVALPDEAPALDDEHYTYASEEEFKRDEEAVDVLPEPYDRLFEQYSDRGIGAFARAVFEKLLLDPRIKHFLKELQKKEYSREHLAVYHPVLTPHQEHDEARYYAKPYQAIDGQEYYLCNDWYNSRRGTLEDWLRDTVLK